MGKINRNAAVALLKKYNAEDFHIRHALTVEQVMMYFAKKLGYEADAEFWGIVGLLHDVDYGKFPEAHCVKAPEILAEIDAPEALVHAVVSHGYGICADVAPEHEMEKVLYATDELTGLIYAYSLMRPEKSVQGMKLKSLKKKYKDKKFAAGVDRTIIERGAEMLGWELSDLLAATIDAMEATEEETEAALKALG